MYIELIEKIIIRIIIIYVKNDLWYGETLADKRTHIIYIGLRYLYKYFVLHLLPRTESLIINLIYVHPRAIIKIWISVS